MCFPYNKQYHIGSVIGEAYFIRDNRKFAKRTFYCSWQLNLSRNVKYVIEVNLNHILLLYEKKEIQEFELNKYQYMVNISFKYTDIISR
jgi:helix-turn-helix protein